MQKLVLAFAFILSSSAFAAPSENDELMAIPAGTQITFTKDRMFAANSGSDYIGKGFICRWSFSSSSQERVLRAGSVLTVSNVSNPGTDYIILKTDKPLNIICSKYTSNVYTKIGSLVSVLAQEGVAVTYPQPTDF